MSKKPELETRYANRRKKIIKQIKGEAALFPSAPEFPYSRDQFYPFRQNSDFFYLTGLAEADCALVLLGSSRGPRSVLFLRDRDPIDERWNGERIGLKRAKRRFDADEVRDIKQFEHDLPALLQNASVLHYAPGAHPRCDTLIWNLLKDPAGPRSSFPHILKDSRLMTGEMRLVKDRHEIGSMKHVCDLTARAFLSFAPLIKQARSEKHAAQLLEAEFARLGGHALAFPTIVASGRNATVLHHTPQLQPLWKHELVLVDAGASFNGYCADLTRTMPAAGTFSDAQAKVYDIVHRALVEATGKAAPGSTLDQIHQTAVRTITAGLSAIGVLRGSISDLIQSEAYRRYYMHRTSHWLGIDVHDAFPIYRDNTAMPPNTRPLEPGNIITIEPGIYLDPKDADVPVQYRGIGIRIEDSVLITNSGCEVLTWRMPSAREEIESLCLT